MHTTLVASMDTRSSLIDCILQLVTMTVLSSTTTELL